MQIGTGEGAQSYGHGLYFAENPAVAESYQANVRSRDVGGQEEGIAARYLKVSNSRAEAIQRMQQAADNIRNRSDQSPAWQIQADLHDRARQLLQQGWSPPKGNLYQVSINADPADFIDLDVPWNEQPQKVRDIIRAAGSELKDNVPMHMESVLADLGDDIRYKQLQEGKITQDEYNSRAGSDRHGRVAVAQALRDAGVPGFKYLDEGSRRGTVGGEATSSSPDMPHAKWRNAPLRELRTPSCSTTG